MSNNERVLFIITHYCKGNKAEFARVLGVKPQTVNGWCTRNISSSVYKQILDKYKNISRMWLLTGEGSIFNDPSIEPTIYNVTADKITSNGSSTNYGKGNTIHQGSEMLDVVKRQLEMLEKQQKMMSDLIELFKENAKR